MGEHRMLATIDRSIAELGDSEFRGVILHKHGNRKHLHKHYCIKNVEYINALKCNFQYTQLETLDSSPAWEIFRLFFFFQVSVTRTRIINFIGSTETREFRTVRLPRV